MPILEWRTGVTLFQRIGVEIMGLSAFRGFLYLFARLLGDVSAVRNRTVGRRWQDELLGRHRDAFSGNSSARPRLRNLLLTHFPPAPPVLTCRTIASFPFQQIRFCDIVNLPMFHVSQVGRCLSKAEVHLMQFLRDQKWFMRATKKPLQCRETGTFSVPARTK